MASGSPMRLWPAPSSPLDTELGSPPPGRVSAPGRSASGELGASSRLTSRSQHPRPGLLAHAARLEEGEEGEGSDMRCEDSKPRHGGSEAAAVLAASHGGREREKEEQVQGGRQGA